MLKILFLILLNLNNPKNLETIIHTTYYSIKYRIPKNIAFGILYYESGFDINSKNTNWNPYVKSNMGAYGPMQIIPYWGEKYLKPHEIPKWESIKFNIDLGLRILAVHYKNSKDWKLALGKYNTGKFIINDYSIKVFNYKL